MSAQLTPGNAAGRTFKVKYAHQAQGSLYRCNLGDTGVLKAYDPNDGRCQIYLYDGYDYLQAFGDARHLDIGPTPTAANLVGFPFRCVAGYTTRNNFTINYREEGSIVKYDPKTGKVEVSIPSRNERNWTRLEVLHVGRTRKFGDVVVDTGLPSLSTNPSSSELDDTDAHVAHLLYPLICNIMSKKGQLSFLPDWLNGTLPDTAAVRKLCQRIAKGIRKAGLADAFKKDANWDWKKFVDRGIKIQRHTVGQGLYARFYSNFNKPKTPLRGSDPRVYVGKTTVGFGDRNRDHDSATHNPNNENYTTGHYRIARQASQHDAIVLAYLDGLSEREIAIAEQALVLLLRAYRPEVLTWVPRVEAGQPAKSAANDLSDAMGDIVATVEAREAATQLTQLAENLFQQKGWGKYLKTSGGCNKDSPLASSDQYEKLLWTMVDYPDRYVYYRTPYKPYYSEGATVFFDKTVRRKDGTSGSFAIKRREKDHPQPPKGGLIHLSVEIMKHGRHPEAYSRLPDYGIWSNWDDANQVAVRIRYKDAKGQWYSYYMQNGQDFLAMQSSSEPGSIGVYMDMINLRNYLERKTFVSKLPWFESWGTARVKQLKFDHLTQTIEIGDPPAPSPAVLPTPVRDENALRAAYTRIGLTNYGKVKTDPTINWSAIYKKGKGGTRRAVCDICWLSGRRHNIHPQAYKGQCYDSQRNCVVAGSGCMYCDNWGHRCTFTQGDIAEGLYTALVWYPPRPLVATKIADPGFESHTLVD